MDYVSPLLAQDLLAKDVAVSDCRRNFLLCLSNQYKLQETSGDLHLFQCHEKSTRPREGYIAEDKPGSITSSIEMNDGNE